LIDLCLLTGYLGMWLLDGRLINKKLDVRIRGTQGNSCSKSFYKGRYEGRCGFIFLDRIPDGVDGSVEVKMGVDQTRRRFQARHLFPETTTERPPHVDAEAAKPMVSVLSQIQRVVIIGPDVYGNSNAVGSYGEIVNSGYELLPGQALVMLTSGPYIQQPWYFHERSLCRSDEDHLF
jgi:hypothetical protein